LFSRISFQCPSQRVERVIESVRSQEKKKKIEFDLPSSLEYLFTLSKKYAYRRSRKRIQEPVSLNAKTKNRNIVPCIILFTILKGIILIFLIPPFQTPDEFNHYDYAVFLSKIDVPKFLLGKYDIERTEDVVVTSEVSRLLDITDALRIRFHKEEKAKVSMRQVFVMARSEKELDTAESLGRTEVLGDAYNYPPFYYGFLSLFLRLMDLFSVNIFLKFLFLRLVSFCLFMASLYFVTKILRLIPFSESTAAVILFLIAFQPQLSMLSVSVQPDIMVLFLVTGCIYFALRFIIHSTSLNSCLFGLLSGLLLLTKVHFFLAVYFPLVVMMILILVRKKRFYGKSAAQILAGGLLAAVIGVWWYIRSYLLFDNLIGYVAYETSPDSFLANVKSWFFYWMPLIFKRFWGEWGWVDYAYPLYVFPFLLILCLVPLPFWISYINSVFKKAPQAGRYDDSPEMKKWLNLVVLFLPLLVFSLIMIYIAGEISPEDNNQGRNWLPLILPIAVYLGGYLDFLAGSRKFQARRIKRYTVVYFYSAIFFLLNLWMILLTIKRYYPI